MGYFAISSTVAGREGIFQPEDLAPGTVYLMRITVLAYEDELHTTPAVEQDPSDNILELWVMRTT
jgi:hypothetical protein